MKITTGLKFEVSEKLVAEAASVTGMSKEQLRSTYYIRNINKGVIKVEWIGSDEKVHSITYTIDEAQENFEKGTWILIEGNK